MTVPPDTRPPLAAIIYGMISAIWGGVLIGLAVATVLVDFVRMWRQPGFLNGLADRPQLVWYYLATVGNLVVAAFLMRVGIALLSARPRARRSALVTAVLAAVWGVCSLLISYRFSVHGLFEDGIGVAVLRLFAAQGGGAVAWVLYGVTLFVAMIRLQAHQGTRE